MLHCMLSSSHRILKVKVELWRRENRADHLLRADYYHTDLGTYPNIGHRLITQTIWAFI